MTHKVKMTFFLFFLRTICSPINNYRVTFIQNTRHKYIDEILNLRVMIRNFIHYIFSIYIYICN